jgi:uroporphyrinogen-III synthase
VAILLTRPAPDNQKTAAALRAAGYDVLLAPMLRFEPVPFDIDEDEAFAGIVLTSANAARAAEASKLAARLRKLPVFAVGDHTAAVAREAGFSDVLSAGADGATLRELIVERVAARSGKSARGALLYLAGENLSRDLGRELALHGLTLVTKTAYRMAAVHSLPPDVGEAFARGGIEAVMHFSARSARAFVEAARDRGLEVGALALAQFCISAHVASVLRDAGAAKIVAAEHPDESHLIDALRRAVRPTKTA